MKQNHTLRPILAALVIFATFVGCNTTGSEDPGPIALISRIEIQPEEISSMDTVRVTVFLAQLQQKNIVYKWNFRAMESSIIDQKIGTILNGHQIDKDGFTQTDSAYVVWKPDGYVGLAVVEVKIVPLTGSYEPEGKAIVFRINAN